MPRRLGAARTRIDLNRGVLARRVVAQMGGRFSRDLGIDVDAGRDQIERWFFAATLLGAHISAQIALRSYRVFADFGATTLAQAAQLSRDELVGLLDRGGYARYDYRTADRILALGPIVSQRSLDQWSAIGNCAQLERELDALPGWGPTTVGLFLRELRGRWPGAEPPVHERVRWSARHLGLFDASPAASFQVVVDTAAHAGVDPRDLEAALMRLGLAHRHGRPCPGGVRCAVLVAASSDHRGDVAGSEASQPAVFETRELPDTNRCAIGVVEPERRARERNPSVCGPPDQ